MNFIKAFFRKDTRSIEEKLFTDGKKYALKSNSHSAVFFTTWKCGTVIADQIFKQMSHSLKLQPVDYQTYVEYNMNKPYDRLQESHFLNTCFQEKGYFYGPFKLYIDIPNLHNYKVIVQLRDPRDVMTSMYFSFAFSHAGINEYARNIKKEFLNSDVNSMALKYAPQYLTLSYKPYMELLKNNNQVLFVKYEEMVTAFDSWLDRICNHLDVKLSDEEKQRINTIADFKVDKENIHSHKRSVQPGNYKKHLTETTIAELDKIFSEVNSFYGY
jgi:hypothetical protein